MKTINKRNQRKMRSADRIKEMPPGTVAKVFPDGPEGEVLNATIEEWGSCGGIFGAWCTPGGFISAYHIKKVGVRSKLTTHQIQEIRCKARNGWNEDYLCDDYQISRSQLTDILTRKTWDYVPDITTLDKGKSS